MWRDEVPSGGALHWVRKQYRDTGREQGVTGWFDRELLPFLRWLDPNLSDLSVRLAPSLIIRGETELLGLAYPRFGIRVRTGCGSLMNLRRTCDMIRAISERNPLDAEQLVRDIRSGSCIADCLLSEREAKAQGFRLITCDLGEAFGEEEPLPGVPFVKHTELGGGMCVQACYCMASYLLHDLVRPVCGIAETTMEARSRWLTTSHGGTGVCSVDIGGLTPFDSRSVVEDGGSNGLSVHLASITNPGPLAAGSSLTALSSLRATSFIRSHIESGWPMIAYVSMSRMYGDHHLHFAERKFDRDVTVMLSHAERERYLKQVGASQIRNRIELSRLGPVDRRQEQTQQHAVLIVGSSVTSFGSSPADHEFLINDPATLPFLKATTADLYECRQYRPEAEGGALRIASALSRRTGSPQVAELVAGRRICNIRRLPESEVDAALQNQNRNFSGTTSIDSRARIVVDESELKPTGRQVRVLSWPDSEILQTHLLDSLVRAIDLSGVDLLRDHVSIALELEPGPLYLLRDWTTLESLCMRMNHHAHPAIRQATGFNLDIAHWRLADISIEQVRADAEVRKDSMLPDTSIHTSILQRVVHAHAAGHHPAGHFADGPLLRAGKLAGENHFRPWIALLKERCRLQSPLPFSGQVSLEFEAAPSISAVMESLHDLGRLLQST